MHSEPNQPAIKYFNNLTEKILRRVHLINLHITEEDLYSKQIKIIINPIIIKKMEGLTGPMWYLFGYKIEE